MGTLLPFFNKFLQGYDCGEQAVHARQHALPYDRFITMLPFVSPNSGG
jgi:hypothetical protein